MVVSGDRKYWLTRDPSPIGPYSWYRNLYFFTFMPKPTPEAFIKYCIYRIFGGGGVSKACGLWNHSCLSLCLFSMKLHYLVFSAKCLVYQSCMLQPQYYTISDTLILLYDGNFGQITSFR